MGLFRWDNDKREARVHELSNDINSMIVTQGELANQIGDQLTRINAYEAKHGFSDIAKYEQVNSASEVDLFKKVWTLGKVAGAIALDTKLYQYFARSAAIKILTTQGTVASEAAIAAVQLSRSTKFISFAKGTGITVAVAIGVEAISDEWVCGQLRAATQDLLPTRVSQRKNIRIATQVTAGLAELLTKLGMLEELDLLNGEGGPAHVKRAVEATKTNIQKMVELITDEKMKQELAEFDSKRHSWTEEG